jgi:predicted DNA-binding WGR domain protein
MPNNLPNILDTPLANFNSITLHRINPEQNEYRFYQLKWTSTLLDDGAIVRIYGRINGGQRILSPLPYSSIEDAWSMICKQIHKRLNHGYQVAGLSVG